MRTTDFTESHGWAGERNHGWQPRIQIEIGTAIEIDPDPDPDSDFDPDGTRILISARIRERLATEITRNHKEGKPEIQTMDNTECTDWLEEEDE